MNSLKNLFEKITEKSNESDIVHITFEDLEVDHFIMIAWDRIRNKFYIEESSEFYNISYEATIKASWRTFKKEVYRVFRDLSPESYILTIKSRDDWF